MKRVINDETRARLVLLICIENEILIISGFVCPRKLKTRKYNVLYSLNTAYNIMLENLYHIIIVLFR